MRTTQILSCVLVAALGFTGCSTGDSRRTEAGPQRDLAKDRAEAIRLFNRAKGAQDDRKWARAEELYKQGLALDDDISGAWNNYGVVLLEQQRYMDAVPVFGKAADLSPKDPTPYENLGLLYHRAGYAQEALESYAKSLERDPNWLPSLRGAVVCAKQLNRSDEESFDRAKRALLIERDEQWRRVFRTQMIRIENDLKEASLSP